MAKATPIFFVFLPLVQCSNSAVSCGTFAVRKATNNLFDLTREHLCRRLALRDQPHHVSTSNLVRWSYRRWLHAASQHRWKSPPHWTKGVNRLGKLWAASACDRLQHFTVPPTTPSKAIITLHIYPAHAHLKAAYSMIATVAYVSCEIKSCITRIEIEFIARFLASSALYSSAYVRSLVFNECTEIYVQVLFLIDGVHLSSSMEAFSWDKMGCIVKGVSSW